jgi:S1-C subfamily serine protease
VAETIDWAFPTQLQPRPEELRFDLRGTLESVVKVHAEVPDDAFTAHVLGTERLGHGVVIAAEGLVLTIGYLVAEATSIWLTSSDGTVTPAHALAYDHVTGFGLIMPHRPLAAVPLERAIGAGPAVGDPVIVVGHGGLAHTLAARLIARREFAGYWEYLLEEALFTAPAHPQWGGAALLDERGQLLGIGSLLLEETVEGRSLDINMFVPVELLEPILPDMIRYGRPRRAARPWLGIYMGTSQGRLVVGGLSPAGPAHEAGMRPGDVVLEVCGQPVRELGDMFRGIWRAGSAGAEVPVTLRRGDETLLVRVRSADRDDYLRKPARH